MKVFIGGARQLRSLNPIVITKLQNTINKNFEILIGDANGIDSSVQRYYSDNNYRSVIIYASNGKVRNNIGQWNVISVDVPKGVTGFDFYVQKDIQMAKDADYGFMIWNGKSRGTWNNVINMTKQNKSVLLYLSVNKKIYKLSSLEEAEKFKKNIMTLSSQRSVSVQVDTEEDNQLRLF